MEENRPKHRKKNSTTVDLAISLAVHAVVISLVIFFAAREGVLGSKLKEITVAIVPKEIPPPEPEKPPPPVLEPPKEEPKVAQETTPSPPVEAAPPPVQTSSAPPAVAVAPAAVVPADFSFNDGAKEVITGTNAAMIAFRSQVEYTLRSNWERPDGLQDESFVAEVELSLDASGRITKQVFKKKSGNSQWDDSVTRAIVATKTLSLPQPKGFNGPFLVRFDVLPASAELLAP